MTVSELEDNTITTPAANVIDSDAIVGLGEVFFLNVSHPGCSARTLEEISASYTPSMIRGNFRSYASAGGPLAVATWAFVSDEISQALREEPRAIAPEEHGTGDNLWIAELVVPFGREDEILSDLTHAFEGQTGQMMRRQHDGSLFVAPFGTD